MNFDKTSLRLYAVTDRAWTGRQTLCQQVEAALRGGVTCVQLREKHLDRDAFLAEARQVCALCHRYGVPFIVNDDLDVALASGADGVHVGQDDLPVAEVRRRAGRRLIVGVSAHGPGAGPPGRGWRGGLSGGRGPSLAPPPRPTPPRFPMPGCRPFAGPCASRWWPSAG